MSGGYDRGDMSYKSICLTESVYEVLRSNPSVSICVHRNGHFRHGLHILTAMPRSSRPSKPRGTFVSGSVIVINGNGGCRL